MKMGISVFLFIIININLVLTDDNKALESSVTYRDTKNVLSEPEDSSQNDQVAESSNSISQTYTNIHNDNQLAVGKTVDDGGHVYEGQSTQQNVHSSDALSHDNNKEVLQPALTQGYPHQLQPIYVQYPIQIFGAEAAPLYQHQMQETEGQTLGYSSYVEHVSQKDEEDIKSALKEGSVSDIKRLVPKSGISFKIYKQEKNINTNLENPKVETESTHIPGSYLQSSKLHHRIKEEVPVIQVSNQHLQSVYNQQQQTAGLESYQNEHTQQSVGAVSHSQNQISVHQHSYYPQSETNSQKTFLEANGKNSLLFKPNFKINVEDNSNKATSAVEFNSLTTNRGTKYGLNDISNYHKQWHYDTKLEGSQKNVKKLKPATLQYEIDPVAPVAPVAQAERSKHYYTQTQEGSHVVQTNFNKHKTNYFPEGHKNGNYQATSYTARGNQNNVAKKGYSDKKVAANLKNRLPGNYANVENIKPAQNQIVGHLGNAYPETQSYKGSQSEYFATTSYPDSEPAKSGQHNFISHVETKNIQNFDHQKALEGSTSFDIKNAIDTTGSLVHQTNPTSEIHSFDDIQKQQLAYVVPKIPAVLLETGAHEAPIAEGHQIKDFGISYHSSPEVNGKFIHQPQAIVWSSEHLKQGNAPTANDLHQPLIKLHLPKEEFYKHIKTHNIELPTSSISYQQKQPFVVHYDVPFVKYPQEIHYQPKTKTRVQNSIKLGQPLAIDWSLFKSSYPNFNINSLMIKPEITPHIQETGKKIVPILIRKRKNRSNNKQEIGMIVYGKVNNKRRPMKPNQRQEKNVRVNLFPEASNNVRQYEPKGERKNEFSVSASYKVDRSFKTQ